MKIALIWPKGLNVYNVLPLSLAYLKSNLEGYEHEVSILDCNLKDLTSNSRDFKIFLEEFKPDLVGVSAWSTTIKESISLIDEVKNFDPKIITVIGGSHPTICPDEVIKNKSIDFLFRGESELSFPLFLEEVRKVNPDFSNISGLVYRSHTQTKKNPIRFEPNLDLIRPPDFDSINLQQYLKRGYRLYTGSKKNAPIQSSRGCPYRCEFCSAGILNGKVIRRQSVEYVLGLIKHLYFDLGIKHINIIDDNFTFDVDHAKKICKAIIDLDLKDLSFGTPNRIRIQKTDSELFALMKKAGWDVVIVPIESGSKRVLDLMKKDLNLDIIPEKIKEIRKQGLYTHGFFIVGYPGETIKDLEETEKLIKKIDLNSISVFNFQPLPGTIIFKELVKDNSIQPNTIPGSYVIDSRVYTPKKLKDFNFSRFILKMHIHVILKEPKNIIFTLSRIESKQTLYRSIRYLLG